ncbi:MAG: MFS transporter [Ktedonobacteraceae bacterium]|nr:MFS transporter [Ktedonobacteraceae bacterium]
MTMVPAMPHGGFLTLLKKRNFLKLWLAQLISMTVFNASNYAILVLIEEVTGSTTLVGLAIICFSLPALLFAAPAGVFVDHMNKRRVLWGSNCLRAIATFIFVISLLTNRHQLVPIYLLTFLISAIGQFFTPAEGSVIALLVGEDELVPALSLFNITFMLSQALGFIVVAPLALSLLPTFTLFRLTIHPVDQLYALVALLYLVCAVLIALIPQASFSNETGSSKGRLAGTQPIGIIGNIWSEIRQGWSFVRSNKPLFLAVIQLSFAGVLLLVIGELATPIVTKLLQLPAKSLALIFAPAGIGLVVGSVLMPRITKHLGKSRAVFSGTVVLTLVALLLPLTTLLARVLQPHGWNANPLLLLTIAIFMCIAGFALDFINIPAQAAIQEQTPDWIKGRVLALQLVLYNACSIPVILFIGVVADAFGLDRVLYLLSLCIIAFGVWGVYYEHKHSQSIAAADVRDKQEELESDKIAQ